MLFMAEKCGWGLLLGLSWVWGACSSPVSRWWTGPVGAISHPFAAQGGMECCDSGGRLGSIRRGDLARGGGHDLSDPRPTAVGEIMR